MPFPFLAAAVGAAAVGGFVSNLLNKSASKSNTDAVNNANLQIARETNQYNLDLYERQVRDAESMYYKTESPMAQVEQLSEAGLNPALAFGESSGSVDMPSAAPSSPTTMLPYDPSVFSDTAVTSALNAIGQIGSSFEDYESGREKQIDNQTRDAMNQNALDIQEAEFDDLLKRSDLSDSQRELVLEQVQNLRLTNRLMEAKYDDHLQLSKLGVKFQELQNRALDTQIENDTARLAIERYNAETGRMLSSAQVHQIKVLSNLAVNADWRDSQQHVVDMNLKNLNEKLSSLQLSQNQKQAVFDDCMRHTELYHEGLKDASEINRLVERAFGLGFRDVGAALKNLFAK